MERECPRCGDTYRQYNTTQTVCRDCYRNKLKAQLASRTPKRTAPLKRSQKPIRTRGKVANKDRAFIDKVVRLNRPRFSAASMRGAAQV